MFPNFSVSGKRFFVVRGQLSAERKDSCPGSFSGSMYKKIPVQWFVNETFVNGTKPQAERMIELITDAFKKGLVEATWMDNETRLEAEKKAEKITNMIGFPDYIINNDFSRVGIVKNPIQFGGTDLLNNTTATNLSALKLKPDTSSGLTTSNVTYSPNSLITPPNQTVANYEQSI